MNDKTVPLPEAGEGCHLAFDVAAMERLHAEFGDFYVTLLLEGLDRHNVMTFKAAIGAMARNLRVSVDEVIDHCVLSELAMKIANAMSLRLYGKTFAEHQQAAVSAALAAAKTDAA